MLGKLDEAQIDNLLLSQSIGRIACTDGKKPYITPVTYIFDGKNIIGQTREGMKLEIIRNNPNVCFEVDVVSSMNNWRSVIVSGTFRELAGEDAEKAREYLFRRVLTLMTSSAIHQHEHEEISEVDDSNRIKPIMYQIEIKEKTGRYEKQ
jgi:nitroimidazol reductase NimA-like FMN-containing flavoprotein (pyridoxamine 5'-phosphate oxidase superfamily)